MTDLANLWWQVQERLAAQAWSCDDYTWTVPAVGGTIGDLLAAHATPGTVGRVEVARDLQQQSESRIAPDGNVAPALTKAWLTLRRIDAALGRAPIDLRSDVALFVGDRLIDKLGKDIAASPYSAAINVTGPGFIEMRTYGRSEPQCAAVMSWPTLVGLAAGTTQLQEAEVDVAGDEAAIDALIDGLVRLRI